MLELELKDDTVNQKRLFADGRFIAVVPPSKEFKIIFVVDHKLIEPEDMKQIQDFLLAELGWNDIAGVATASALPQDAFAEDDDPVEETEL